MKSIPALLTLLLLSCSTTSPTAFQKATAPFVAAATPIAESIVDSYATSKGGAALVPVINDLFSSAAQAWAGNPATTGIASSATASTVAPLIAGAPLPVQATALDMAAQALQSK